MDKQKHGFSIGVKMYLFVIATVFFATACVCAISFTININQIDSYYKRLTVNNARNYVTLTDVDFLSELRNVAESDEYQAIRDRAEAEDDESLIEDYLRQQGLWEKYESEREKMRTYVSNMEDIKYLYIVAWDEDGTELDMYLLDADDVPLYETGYYEVREAEFEGVDPRKTIQPVISEGDWGWLCSGFEPVYDHYGNLVCHVGCDVGMEEVMNARYRNLSYLIAATLGVTVIALAGAFLVVNRTVVSPLRSITSGMRKFRPSSGSSYSDAGVIDLDIRSRDEIGDIYNEIRTMQIKITDYINDITVITNDNKVKDKEIGEISKEAYKDALTGIGNKNAYMRMADQIGKDIADGTAEFAIVMMDVNGLKKINDSYGHVAGDNYLKGNCHIICEHFKHSPVFRIGGDEFVAILTGQDYVDRTKRVEELKASFKKTCNDESLKPWERCSASVGMAELSSIDNTFDLVFRRADKLMYEDKLAFKNNR